MIDPNTFALIGLFAFKRDKDPVENWKPTLRDTADMRTRLLEFPAMVINGKKQYPFEQYCESKGWISFMENGQVTVKNEFQWRRACDTYDLMKWENAKEMERLFAAFPEEEAAYEKRLEVVKDSIRALFGKMTV